jgi:sugar O-acyltransferase (sialic acid O-acetyltransferase NeuD family)
MRSGQTVEIIIIGAGGMAREVAFLLRDLATRGTPYNILGFVIDDSDRSDRPVSGYPIFTDIDDLLDRYHGRAAVIGIGNPKTIRKFASSEKIRRAKLSFPNIVHPSVIWDSEQTRLGQGNIVCAGAICTTDIAIGSYNIINMACTVGHDVEIGNYCVVNPGCNISGHVKLRDGVLVGTGAQILQSVEIGENAVIGAGAVVTKDVQAGQVVVGVPAKPIR